jgi:hypothetical protein
MFLSSPASGRYSSFVPDDFVPLNHDSHTDWLVAICRLFLYTQDFSDGLDEYFGAASDLGRENHREAYLATSAEVVINGEVDALGGEIPCPAGPGGRHFIDRCTDNYWQQQIISSRGATVFHFK